MSSHTSTTATKPASREAASRGVLLGRLAVHTYASGHDRTDKSTIEGLSDTLREASMGVLTWDEAYIENHKETMNEVAQCPHEACREASTRGPKGLKEVFEKHIEDDLLKRTLSEYQDLISGASLGLVNERLQALASMLELPEDIHKPSVRTLLGENLGDGQHEWNEQISDGSQRPMCYRVIGNSEGLPHWIYSSSGSGFTIQEVQDRIEAEFLGNEPEGVSGRSAGSTDDNNPDWTLHTFKTGHLSGAAWSEKK